MQQAAAAAAPARASSGSPQHQHPTDKDASSLKMALMCQLHCFAKVEGLKGPNRRVRPTNTMCKTLPLQLSLCVVHGMGCWQRQSINARSMGPKKDEDAHKETHAGTL